MLDIAGTNEKQIRDGLSLHGYFYIDCVPPRFDYMAALSFLGPAVPQYQGKLIRDIRPDPAVSSDVVSALNMSELSPHTEFYEFAAIPPRYVALWCVRPARTGGGGTTLADGYRFLEGFTAQDRLKLLNEEREWRSRPTLEMEGVEPASCRAPALRKNGEDLVMRFSTFDLRRDRELTSRYIDTGRAFFGANRITVDIEQYAILIWDNWRMMHARTAFTDPQRHLRRILIGAAK